MPAGTIYTVKQVAAIIGIHEQDVEKIIKGGELRATYSQSLLAYSVTQPDLIVYLKAKRLDHKIALLAMKSVLLCDRDPKIALILKGELDRSGATLKVATAAKDAEVQVSEHPPDLLVIHLAAIQRGTDSLRTVLRKARESRPLPVIVFTGEPESKFTGDPDVQRLIAHLNVEACISTAGGTRKLLQTIMQMLGLRTTMGMRRPLGFGGADQAKP